MSRCLRRELCKVSGAVFMILIFLSHSGAAMYQVQHKYSRLPLPPLTGRALSSHLATCLDSWTSSNHTPLLHLLRSTRSLLLTVPSVTLTFAIPGHGVPHPPSRRSFPSFFKPCQPLSAQVIPLFSLTKNLCRRSLRWHFARSGSLHRLSTAASTTFVHSAHRFCCQLR